MTPGIDKEAEILLIKAAEDESVLQLAGIPDGPFGFHIQQAVEKLLKALLCHLAVKYRRTHDLEYLVTLLHDHGETIPMGIVDITQFESYGVAYRYDANPGGRNPRAHRDDRDRPAYPRTCCRPRQRPFQPA